MTWTFDPRFSILDTSESLAADLTLAYRKANGVRQPQPLSDRQQAHLHAVGALKTERAELLYKCIDCGLALAVHPKGGHVKRCLTCAAKAKKKNNMKRDALKLARIKDGKRRWSNPQAIGPPMAGRGEGG